MARPPLRTSAAVALVGLSAIALSACAPAADDAAPAPSPPVVSTSPTPIPTITQTPTAVRLPADCKAMLSTDVLAQLGSTPLNDPSLGPSGVQPDGSLICIWRDPAADTTGLVTTISRMDRGPALDMLNELVTTQGFSCYTPDAGTRCEKTWINDTYPVNDGRTLYWRDDVLIDTQYSNLAPTGYTGSIISAIFG
ncbi:hypothetical protein ACIPVB_04535 [Microbacterium sp. NPDC090007]|uniref:hypothetical protein n=1 Tax=Microbacterium sp. NPDC090007 TaxID=3364204 RepID=UPI00381DBE7A